MTGTRCELVGGPADGEHKIIDDMSNMIRVVRLAPIPFYDIQPCANDRPKWAEHQYSRHPEYRTKFTYDGPLKK